MDFVDVRKTKMSYQNQTPVEINPYVRRICGELSEYYGFSAEELRRVTDWGAVLRTVFDRIPTSKRIGMDEVAWELRGDRTDLKPERMFEGLPQQSGVISEEQLVLIGTAGQAVCIRQKTMV